MYEILKKEKLNDSVTLMVIHAPNVAKKAMAGQFVILRVDERGERIPLTIADFNRQNGTVTVIFQKIGVTTKKLDAMNEGDFISDFVGPLGNPTNIGGYKNVAVVAGGVGCAIALPICKALSTQGTCVHSIIGFRDKGFVILEKQFEKISNRLVVTTNDGSYGVKGLVTDSLEYFVKSGEMYDLVFVVGPLVMMKAVCDLTKRYNIKTIVSMNPIMIDGTGMCGGCRVTVNGKTKFACVDGPDFDGHEIDFDETMFRNKGYERFERQNFEENCSLFKKGKKQ